MASDFFRQHIILELVVTESTVFIKATGIGKPELIGCSGGHLGCAEVDWRNPESPCKCRAVSPKGNYQRFARSLSVGNTNGGGRTELLEKRNWWERPKETKRGQVWEKQARDSGEGGIQTFAYDVNGDGLADVITSQEAHGCEIAWSDQLWTDGGSDFCSHTMKALVTGKRFGAHDPQGDPAPNAPAVLHGFQLQSDRKGDGEVVPCLVDNDSGVGARVTVRHISSKKHPDIIVQNKEGLFPLPARSQKNSAPEGRAVRPKPVNS